MKLLTARQLSEQHGIPPGTSYRMAREGLIPARYIGVKQRGIRFIAEEVLEALKRPAPTETAASDRR